MTESTRATVDTLDEPEAVPDAGTDAPDDSQGSRTEADAAGRDVHPGPDTMTEPMAATESPAAVVTEAEPLQITEPETGQVPTVQTPQQTPQPPDPVTTAAEPGPVPGPGPSPIPDPTPTPTPAPVPTPDPGPDGVPSPPVIVDTPRPSPAPVPARQRVDAPSPSASKEATDLVRGAVTFGRVDADGTVYVLTAGGDRRVGEFPDTAPNEALVYFVRKYEELVGQVDLFAQRLRATDMSSKDARSGLAKLQAATTEPSAVGDLDGLTAWVGRLKTDVDRKVRAQDAERAAARATALAEREVLVVEAEQIAATAADKIHYKTAMDRLREILEEWKTRQKDGPRLDKPSEDTLWKRLSAARTTVDKGRRQHASEMAEQRAGTRGTKETIIAEAESLAASTDWRATGDAFRGLMDRWKAAGRLPRVEDDELWTKFRDAQERFHAARTAAMAVQDEHYRGNLVVKEALLVEAERLVPVTDAESAKRRLRDIQDKWDAAGRVPRADLDRVEKRLQQVADTVRQADASRWTATNPEALARAKDVVRQLETGVAKLEKDLAKAESAGDSRGVERASNTLTARTAWLDQARTALADLGG